MNYRSIAPIMGNLWSPIAAVTSRWQERSNVQIAVAISAASIVPDMPRVLLQIYKTNHSHGMIYNSGGFALNFLRRDQLDLIKTFGFVSGRDKDKLKDVPFRLGVAGNPLLQDCWGYLDCRVVNAMDGGDMTCFLADVVDGDILHEAQAEGEPLWWREARRRLPAGWMEEWDGKIAAEIEISKTRMNQIDLTPDLTHLA
ncbi:MAG: hypothetical protein BZY80_01750 [SAR202 cluster bacterium Io17-Chloro-G2]|nr:MAG: hypothetical protein BZY80_01750 [SAR202 cluster bacterium Io17-Chloro-G2]